MSLKAIKLVQVASEYLEENLEVKVKVTIGEETFECDVDMHDFAHAHFPSRLVMETGFDLDEIDAVCDLRDEVEKLEKELEELREANQQLESQVEDLKSELAQLTP